jgi:hypothetical protein
MLIIITSLLHKFIKLYSQHKQRYKKNQRNSNNAQDCTPTLGHLFQTNDPLSSNHIDDTILER